jgi:hypothetical protein
LSALLATLLAALSGLLLLLTWLLLATALLATLTALLTTLAALTALLAALLAALVWILISHDLISPAGNFPQGTTFIPQVRSSRKVIQLMHLTAGHRAGGIE